MMLTPADRVAIVARYRMVAEHAPLPLALTIGDSHELCDANPAFHQLLSPQSAVQLGKPLINSLPVMDADCLRALLDQVYQTGVAARRVEAQLLQMTHDQRVWAWTIWPIRDQQDRSVGLVLLIEDMYANQRDQQVATDARLINEQLLLSGLREHELAEQIQHQLTVTHTITTSLSEGLYVLDTAGRCTFANPAAERILGWTTNELQGKDMRDILPFALINMLDLGTAQRSDNAPFVHQNGSVVPTAYAAAPRS